MLASAVHSLPIFSQFLAATSEVEHEAMNPAITCRATDSLSKVMRQVSRVLARNIGGFLSRADSLLLLALPQLCVSRIHRTYLCNEKNQPMRVISLSDILNLFVREPPGYLAASFNLS